jgi:hypothetical protein
VDDLIKGILFDCKFSLVSTRATVVSKDCDHILGRVGIPSIVVVFGCQLRTHLTVLAAAEGVDIDGS